MGCEWLCNGCHKSASLVPSPGRLAPNPCARQTEALTSSKPALAIMADLGLKATARLGPFGWPAKHTSGGNVQSRPGFGRSG